MFNTEDILARLQKGETVDDIANELAAALNTATKQLEEEKAKAAAAEAEKKANAQKIAYIKSLFQTIVAYINEFHPDLEIDGHKISDFENFNDEEALEFATIIDGYLELLSSPIMSIFGSTNIPKINTKVEKTPTGIKLTSKVPNTEAELDSIFGDFFKSMKI